MFAQDEGRSSRGPCARVVLALFGGLFLIALLSVPVTTTTSKLRQDQGSNIVTRTTYPRKSRMFLPSYLALRAHPGEGRSVRVRSTQWVATMAVLAVLGLLDYAVFCRLLLPRMRRPDADAD